MDYPINADRGEVAITLDGSTYPMRPTYEAQVAIEGRLGVSMDELFVRARRLAASLESPHVSPAGSGFKVAEMAVIICEGVNAAGKARNEPMLKDWTLERVGELVAKCRWECNKPITEFLMNAIFGGADPKKEKAGNGPPAQESALAAS